MNFVKKKNLNFLVYFNNFQHFLAIICYLPKKPYIFQDSSVAFNVVHNFENNFVFFLDVLLNPLLFVRHLYAMSFKIRGNQILAEDYKAICFKYTMNEIENFIESNSRKALNQSSSPDLNNNTTLNPRTSKSDVDRLKFEDNISVNAGLLSSDSESDNHSNSSSLNVYCMQTKVNGKTINFTDVPAPYKLGDFMYLKNDQKNSEAQKLDNSMANMKLDVKKRHELSQDSPNKSPETSAKHSFQIHQSRPDLTQYDFYTREKDELMSFVCHGKEADIEDADYQEVYELKPSKSPNQDIMMELVFHLNNDYISCFSLIKDDLLLVASEKGDFHLVRPLKDKWDFSRFTLRPKFNGNDAQHYKMGLKTLIDMCFDAKGNLILLNRWKFKQEDPNQEDVFKYTVELYSFNHKITETIIYIKTLCCFSNSESVKLPPTPTEKQHFINPVNTSNLTANDSNLSKADRPPIFTRVYNDEKNGCIILIDSTNSKIYWFKKTTGSKKRCLKSQDNSLKDPRALALSYDEKESETIYISSSSGLVAFNKNFTIKHDALNCIQDIYYDQFEKCLLFVDRRVLYGGRISQKNQKASQEQQSANTDLRYRRLHSNLDASKANFSRLTSSKNYVFILSDEKKNFKSNI
ncbi:hypothetical protein BpHYR1_043331 [Brachionus plicatilis]|uniref:Uncharacterized protein n=1 Tax=Brachionus plicatilis TaxID=10195 RepID=A0A3M7QHU0_BRAPC|nr:hypothetical protein BpHYR1_043331 [Brachionus plicatilis]